jgi:hypothetical protein
MVSSTIAWFLISNGAAKRSGVASATMRLSDGYAVIAVLH